MADIVTGTTTGQVDLSALLQDHANIRHDVAAASANGRYENAVSEANIRRDVEATSGDTRREQAEIGAAQAFQNATQSGAVVDAVKTAGWANSDRTGTEADRIVAQDTAYFIASQSQNFANATAIAALKATTDAGTAATLASIQLAAQQATAATALEGAKTAAASALGQALIGQQIVQDGNITRALINDLKYHDQNRMLIERNAEIVENRDRCHYWQGQYQNALQANLVSQVNALNSQFQETRQGMVNFGTMAGVGQTSTSNNVR